APAAVSIAVQPNDTVCQGTTLIFTATPINGGPNPSYQWTVNGQNVGNNSATFTSNTLNNGDTIQVIMTSSSSCLQGPAVVQSNKIIIRFGLEASCITFGANVGGPATVIVNISGGAAPYTFTVTNFGDNTNATQNNVNAQSATFTHTYNAPGNYVVNVTVVDANGCQASSSCNILIRPNDNNLPDANFTSQPSSGCGSVTVQFTNSSTNADSYIWYFGDGDSSTAVNPSHTYTSPGTYHVTLIAINANGRDTLFKPNAVIVYPQPKAFAYANEVCLGEPTEFTDESESATNWSWDFGDGNTSNLQNPSHTYADTGTYTVRMSISGLGGCTDSYTFIVKVSPRPIVNFTYVDSPSCGRNIVKFTNNS
ncbi:MAG: PKD domain-containing protein, partial [Bacteroidia bacterium]|nr:PKD domain-containing protein [Bacteroidia bacterium]